MLQHNATGTSRLLINEEPLQVLPSLAVAIGLNEAIILQQMHYWMRHSTHNFDGVTWIYNTYAQWRQQFPFWSADTIKRAIVHMEHLGIIRSTACFNKSPIDKTKWYTINYDRLNEFCEAPTMHLAPSTMHLAPSTMHLASLDDASCPVSQETTQETTDKDPPPLTTFGDPPTHAREEQLVDDSEEAPETVTLTADTLMALYNTLAPEGSPQAQTLTESRKKKARAYLKQFPDINFWKTAFRELHESTFLRGGGDRGWRPAFDWFLSKGQDGVENCVKVVEGQYRDTPRTGGRSQGTGPIPDDILISKKGLRNLMGTQQLLKEDGLL
jgi:hypothetical protein